MEPVSIKGPVEQVDGKLMLRIPLVYGGAELAKCTRGIGEIKGEFLEIELRHWLAEKLGVTEGSLVHIDNNNGKFNISPAGPEPSA